MEATPHRHPAHMVLHWQQVGLHPCRKTMMKLPGCHTCGRLLNLKCVNIKQSSDVGMGEE